MNLSEHIRQLSEIDSRRVSTGLTCMMVHESKNPRRSMLNGLLSLIYELNALDSNVIRIHPETGYDIVSCMSVVVPKNMLLVIETVLQDLGRASLPHDSTNNTESLKRFQKLRDQMRRDVFDAIRDHLILVWLDPKGPGGIPDARKHDVYVYTREQEQPQAKVIPYIPIKEKEYQGVLKRRWTDTLPKSPGVR